MEKQKLQDHEREEVGVMPVRKEVEWFSKWMEKKLRANDHKEHWSRSPIAYLFGRLMEELGELGLALCDAALLDEDDPRAVCYDEEIVGEAVDVANFAMMIADKLSLGRTGNPVFKDDSDVAKFYDYLVESTREAFESFEKARRQSNAMAKDKVIG